MTHSTETKSRPARPLLRKLGLSALLSCTACCTLSLLGAVGGSGIVTALSALLRPGSEWLVGGSVFALAFCFLSLRQRWQARRRSASAGKPASSLA